MWWASAGEKKSGLVEEEEQEEEDEMDRALLLSTDQGDDGGRDGEEGSGGLTKEMAIVGYFHRLTGLIFATVSDAISRVDGEGVRRGGGGADDGGAPSGRGSVGSDEGVQGLGLVHSVSDPSTNSEGEGEDSAEEEGESDPNVSAAPPPPNQEDENEPLLPRSHSHANESREDSSSSLLGQGALTETVEITTEDMTQMGLDVWSSADRCFVEELVPLWWGREAVVRGGRVECCGVRLL